MRVKRARRVGTTGALVAATLGASIVLTPSSASASGTWDCHGTQVKRCTMIWWDPDADTFRARAKITDADGGGNYRVKVNNVRLQRYMSSTGWVTVRHADDNDGWHAISDLAGTSTIDPCSGPPNSFRAVAAFYWKGASSGSETWHPNSATSRDC
ncbi:hypothetical protein ACFWWC_26480 [Streptomyces sp. NPDC058642]|uniref:hypothetical protein n=1 Tax=Streptomyces sp. NPDC058642 TaxID=3346572 RepID=UPI00364D54F9